MWFGIALMKCIQMDTFGQCLLLTTQASSGAGVFEIRIPTGPGYWVYYMQTADVVYLLLVGGDKSSQQGDIEKAQQMAAEIREETSDD